MKYIGLACSWKIRYISEPNPIGKFVKFINTKEMLFIAFEGNEKLTIWKLKNNDGEIGSTYVAGAVEWRVKYL